MACIRQVKTASGAVAVQIAYKEHAWIIRIEHIGSADNADDLNTLVAVARQRLNGSQLSLFVGSVTVCGKIIRTILVEKLFYHAGGLVKVPLLSFIVGGNNAFERTLAFIEATKLVEALFSVC
jgi:hypothetical protein